MPDLNTRLHLDMLEGSKRTSNVLLRVIKAAKRELLYGGIYGLQWGDPDFVEPLRFVKDKYLLPYVNAEHTAVEIGPGGGRWTRYMIGFKKLYVVDYYADLLKEARRRINKRNVEFIKNGGTDFPGILERSVNYLFSFGTFVHLDQPIIESYLKNMRGILAPRANVVIHYSDKTKVMAQINDGFADMTPQRMRELVLNAGYTIEAEDLTTMWHSSIVRFTV